MNSIDDQALAAMHEWRDHRKESAALWLVNEFTPMLRGVAHRVLPLPWMVDDAVQTAWMKFFRSVDTFDPQIPISAWAVFILKNVCSNVTRSWRRRAVISVGDLPSEDPGDLEPQSDHTSTTEALMAREDLRRVLGGIGKLADTDQLIVSQMFMSDASAREVALQTGLSAGAVRLRAFRIRNALRAELAAI